MAKITFIARMTVQPAKRQAFIALCRQLEAYVREHEPEVLWYEFFQLRAPDRFAILECFPDEATEHRHMNSSKLAALAPQIGACLVGTWEREYLDALDAAEG